jgi:hypothetical protein
MDRTQNSRMYSSLPREARLRLPDYETPGKLKDAGGYWLQSFAIVATEASELTAPIHPRMPIKPHARDYHRWLDQGESERLPLDLQRPFDASEMEMQKANAKVNSVRNNGPEMLDEVDLVAQPGEPTTLVPIDACGQGPCSHRRVTPSWFTFPASPIVSVVPLKSFGVRLRTVPSS